MRKTLLVKTKYGSFRCRFESERDMGGYAVESLDIQGAVSWGRNLAEAKKKIAEAIEGVVEVQVIARAEEKGEVKVTRHPKESSFA